MVLSIAITSLTFVGVANAKVRLPADVQATYAQRAIQAGRLAVADAGNVQVEAGLLIDSRRL